MTRAAKTVNNAVVGANLHLLFPLSLLPFTAGWMGKNQFARLRTCLYGVNRLVVALPYCLQQLCSVWLHGPDSMLDKAIGRDAKGKGSLIFNLRGMAGDWFASPKPGLAFRRCGGAELAGVRSSVRLGAVRLTHVRIGRRMRARTKVAYLFRTTPKVRPAMQPRPNIVRCLGLLGSVAFSLVGCATTIPDSPEACKFEKLADVPVRMSASNHPIVVIEIDGKLVHMVLDTGATGTLIFASSLERNGMQIDRRVHGMGIGIGGLSKLDILLAERAKIGDLEVKIEHIAVAPFDFSALGGEAIDGILGLDPLGQYDLDLDLPHRRMALYRARYCPNGVPPWENPGRVVPRPANAQYDGRPYAPVSVNGQEFLAMLDTGSNVVIINRHAAATLGVTDQQMAAAPKAMATTASVTAVEARHFRFNSLEFIGLVARDPELAIVELGTGVDLLVGTPILRELRMWIPVQGRKIYFSPPVANN